MHYEFMIMIHAIVFSGYCFTLTLDGAILCSAL